MTAPLSGQILRASDARYSTLYQKAANESVTSSTTLQDDDDFSWTLGVGTWRIEAFLLTNAIASGIDIKTAWAFAGTQTGNSSRACIGPGATSTDTTDGTFRSSGHGITTAVAYGTSTAAGSVIHEDISLTVTVAGVFKLQWAQNASNATALQLTTGSRCFVTLVEAG